MKLSMDRALLRAGALQRNDFGGFERRHAFGITNNQLRDYSATAATTGD